jgi:hypothetical protein
MFHLYPKTVRPIFAAVVLGLFVLMLSACSNATTLVAASTSSDALANSQQANKQQTSTFSALSINVQPYQNQFTVYEVGQAMSYVVATGSDSLGPGDPITATIDWGDKTAPTQYTFIDGRTFQIAGTHAYSKLGKYTLTVTAAITAFQQTTSGTGTVTVVPAYTLAVKNVTSATGQDFNGVVATGTDPFPNDALNGTVNWGDNTTPTNVQVVSSAQGIYSVNATHTYSQVGNFTITLSLTSFIVGPITGTGTATVVAPAFTLSTLNIMFRAMHKFKGTIATVTGTISTRGLSITINWGDGTSTVQHLGRGTGTFSVKSRHTYHKAGNYLFTITVKDNSTGQMATGTGTATVI